jgi:hypothetical protein
LATVHVVSKTAHDIYNVLMSVLKALELDKKRMVGFCSDGGSEYSGKHNGVAAKLVQEMPWILITHCAAHRCALAMTDVEQATVESDGTYGMQFCDTIIRSVHNLFNHSTKRQAQWAAHAEKWGCTRLKFPIFNATRWFSRTDCLVVLAANYAALCLYLQTVTADGKWPVAAAVYATLATSNAVAVIMAMGLLMGVVHALSKELQKDGILPHQVLQAVHEAVAELNRIQQYKLEGRTLIGPVVKKVTSRGVTTLCESIEPIKCSLAGFLANFDTTSGQWEAWPGQKKGIQLSTAEPLDADALLKFIRTMAACLITTLQSRLPTSLDLTCYQAFDPQSYTAMANVSDERLIGWFKVLLRHYARKVDENRKAEHNWYPVELNAKLLEEFKQLLGLMREYMMYQRAPDMITTARAFRDLNDASKLLACPKLVAVLRASLCLPSQSASVERGFSIHRVIKHRLTNRMGILVFDSLMRLRMLGAQYMPIEGSASVDLMVENRKQRSELIDDAVLVLQRTGTIRQEKLPEYMKALGAISNHAVQLSTYGLDGVDDFVVDLERDFAPEDHDEEAELTDVLPEPAVEKGGQGDEIDRELGLVD